MVSRDGGHRPRWRGDGRELYFLRGKQMFVVRISTDPATAPGPPTRLFDLSVAYEQGLRYGVGGDATRFLVMEPMTSATYFLRVTLGWQYGPG